MRFVKALVAFAVLAVVVWTCVCRPYKYEADSLAPALRSGDNVLVLKSWCDRPLRRGDIVLFERHASVDSSQASSARLHFARIAALPGETISLSPLGVIQPKGKRTGGYTRQLYVYDSRSDDRLRVFLRSRKMPDRLAGYVDTCFARSLSEWEAEQVVRHFGSSLPLRRYAPVGDVKNVTLAADEYWLVSGDMADALDSRTFGAIPRNAIKGRALFVVFSRSEGETDWGRTCKDV